VEELRPQRQGHALRLKEGGVCALPRNGAVESGEAGLKEGPLTGSQNQKEKQWAIGPVVQPGEE
jgi:hypothetical protein